MPSIFRGLALISRRVILTTGCYHIIGDPGAQQLIRSLCISKQVLERRRQRLIMKLVLRCEGGRWNYTLTAQERVRHLSHQRAQRKLGNWQEGRAMQHTRELIGEFRVCRGFRSNAVYRPFKRRGENRV